MRGRRIAATVGRSEAGSPVIWRLGRLPFVGNRLLGQLAEEAEQQRRDASRAATFAVAGDVLSRLAASRQLREAVSAAAGEPLVPTYDAVYQYHRDDSAHVRPHRDGEGYDYVFHLTVAHVAPDDGTAGSRLRLLHDGASAEELSLPLGESVLFRGRNVLHHWTPLAPSEARCLIAVGFRETTHESGRRRPPS